MFGVRDGEDWLPRDRSGDLGRFGRGVAGRSTNSKFGQQQQRPRPRGKEMNDKLFGE